jgi:heterodisulfide reductase subunit D
MVDLDDLRKLAYACKRCSSCRDWTWHDPRLPGFIEGTTKKGFTICPTFKHSPGFESDFPRGKIRIAMGLAEEAIEIDEELIKKIYECTACGNCSEHCPATRQDKLDPLDAILRTRQLLLERGYKPPENLKHFVQKKVRSLPIPTKWISDETRTSTDNGSIGFFPGCVSPSIVSRLFPGIARSFITLLQRLELNYQTIDEGWCCGYLQYNAGDIESVRNLIENNLQVLRSRKIETLVTTCAGCYLMFQKYYPEISSEWREAGIEVLHSSQLLHRNIPKLKTIVGKQTEKQTEKQTVVAYHDPCDLGRKSNVFEQPREVLKILPGMQVIELEQNRENSFCCAGGSGLKIVNPDMALDIAVDRIEQAQRAGAEMLVSCCPACLWSLGEAVERTESELQVIDLCEILAHYV